MKKSNIATAVICAVVLSATSFYSGYAASGSSGITYNSQGKIVFNNGTSSKTDDVVFDASDFTTIDNMVSSGKSNIVSELNKYSTTNISATNPTFSQLATAISNISAGTDATANHILSGKKALVGKNIVTGSMPSKQAATYTPGTSDQIINSGQYLSGNQTIKGDQNLAGANIVSGKSIFGVAGSHICATLQTQTSDATATEADILSGKTAYVNGNKVEGSIPSKQAATYTPGTSDQIINSGQYLSGNQTIKGDQNLAGANIVSGKSIFGVAGSHICSTLQSQTSDATATEADILLGKTAYVNGSKKTGNMADNGAVSKTLSVGESYTIPQGYHNGSGIISVPEDANLISKNIKDGVNIFGVTGSLNILSSSENGKNLRLSKITSLKTDEVSGQGVTNSKTYRFTQDYDYIIFARDHIAGIMLTGAVNSDVKLNNEHVGTVVGVLHNIKSGDVLKVTFTGGDATNVGGGAYVWHVYELTSN